MPGRLNLQSQPPCASTFPTACETHFSPINFKGKFNLEEVLNDPVAPPFDQDAFIVNPNLVTKDREVINLLTGFSNAEGMNECTGSFNYTICTLESGIGEYDVHVHNNLTTLENPSKAPILVALANNTAVDHSIDQNLGGHPSTLAGIVDALYTRYQAVIFYYTQYGALNSVAEGNNGYQQYIKPTGQQNVKCLQFRDPREDVVQNMNKLMLLLGAVVATQEASYLEKNLDAGVEVNATTTGYILGARNEFHTDYWFFLGAAIVEAVCILLVAPTYVSSISKCSQLD